MSDLEKKLDDLVSMTGNGAGFGDPDAREQHDREIELLKFKIERRDNMKVAVTSALIGAVVAGVITLGATLIQ
ncbi:MAG: hypothetical protein AAGL10_01275 [Pseudomonadota bacterium]